MPATYIDAVPITLAHPAAVLPLRGLGLPTSALVVGSMAPDAPLFAGWWRGYAVTHGVVGILTVDLLVTLAVLALWWTVLRDALVDLAPAPVRLRLPARVSFSRQQWLLAVPAAWLGALTHVVWDAFTHPGRWGSRNIAWLATEHAGLPGAKWLQYSSGIVGMAVVAAVVVRHVRRCPPGPPRAAPVLSPVALPAVAATALATGFVTLLARASDGLHAMAFLAVVHTLVAAGFLVVVACATWHVARRRLLAASRPC